MNTPDSLLADDDDGDDELLSDEEYFKNRLSDADLVQYLCLYGTLASEIIYLPIECFPDSLACDDLTFVDILGGKNDATWLVLSVPLSFSDAVDQFFSDNGFNARPTSEYSHFKQNHPPPITGPRVRLVTPQDRNPRFVFFSLETH